jgi:ubiquinol-cytochrome c reductase cytochrome c1 subunit
MTKYLLSFVCILFAVTNVYAVGAGETELESAHANLNDRASLQRGAKLFMNYCASCHSAGYVRYSRVAQDLGLSEKQVQDNLNFTGAKFGEQIKATMLPDNAQNWFGAAPPDLSLTVRAKHSGADWVYSYLKSFYVDEKRPLGWNNKVLPGASMPHVLWELQGTQHAVWETDAHGKAEIKNFELLKPGKQSAEAYDQTVRDIVNFMTYMAEPAALQRQAYGHWVILFLAIFTFLAWLLKAEFWRDVH